MAPEAFGLYLILTDPVAGYEACAEAAVRCGLGYLQLRMKGVPDETMLPVARRLRGITRGSTTRFIVNDSVVLVDRYNKMIARGVEVGEALYESAMTRFRPIVLTTITTAGGLAPIILMQSEQGQFLVPMAVSVAAGLIFGTFLTLLLLPSSLYVVSDIRALLHRKKSRAELEPAYSGD